MIQETTAHPAQPVAYAARTDDAATVRLAAQKALARHSFCTLATSSPRNCPNVVGVVYALCDGKLYVHTLEGSRKVRDIRGNANVAVCVPVRRVPMAPPFCVQFQATATVLAKDDAEIVSLIRAGKLKKILAHGALDVPGACFLRIEPKPVLSTFGIGVPLMTLLRDPFHASRTVRLGE